MEEPTTTSQSASDDESAGDIVTILMNQNRECVVTPCEPEAPIGKNVTFRLKDETGHVDRVEVKVASSDRPLLVDPGSSLSRDDFSISRPDSPVVMEVAAGARTGERFFEVTAYIGSTAIAGERDSDCYEQEDGRSNRPTRPRMIVRPVQ